MGLETPTYINGLVVTNPLDSDPKSQGAAHLRLLKSTVKATFPNVAGPVTPTHTELNFVDGVTSPIQAQLDAEALARANADSAEALTRANADTAEALARSNADALLAPKASPTFTGTVTLPATGSGSTEAVRKDYADALAFAAALPAQAGNAGKVVTTDGTVAGWTGLKTINGQTIVGTGNVATGPRNYVVAQYTASATFVVPADTFVIRPYAFGAGAAGNGSTLGGAGGGCAYGDIAVTPGQSVTLTIAAGVATVTISAVDLLVANPGTAGSGGAGGTATKHASVLNGGAYAGGAGASFSGARGGSSSGSPLGAGVTNTYATTGGAGWGGQGGPNVGTGGGVGGPGTATAGGAGLPLDSVDPLLRGLTGLPGYSGTLTNQNGANGGPGAGAGMGLGTGIAGLSGFGAGGAASSGIAGLGGGAAAGGSSLPGFGGGGSGATVGAAVIRIYY